MAKCKDGLTLGHTSLWNVGGLDPCPNGQATIRACSAFCNNFRLWEATMTSSVPGHQPVATRMPGQRHRKWLQLRSEKARKHFFWVMHTKFRGIKNPFRGIKTHSAEWVFNQFLSEREFRGMGNHSAEWRGDSAEYNRIPRNVPKRETVTQE